MSRENEEAAHRVTLAVSRRDIDALIGVTDPDVKWVSVLTPLLGVYEGHEGMRRYLSELAEAFESLEINLDELLGVGGLVIAVGRVRYRGKASGVETEITLGWVTRFRNGRLLRFRTFNDPEQALDAVGLR